MPPEERVEGTPVQSTGLRIFISYRREDAPDAAGRVYDALVDRFGATNVFMDVDNIPPGANFVNVLNEAVAACDVLLAVIGRGWLASADAKGRRRLDNPDDFVRLEIEAALKRDVSVIPVLLHRVTMPSSDELPDSLSALAWRNALEIDHARWRDDVRRLIDSLDRMERKKKEQQVDQLYREALGFMQEGKAGRARETLETILSLDPGHEEASALLDRAREEARLEDLYATPILPSVSFSRSSLTVDPGGVVGTEVVVGNRTDREETFGLELHGDAAGWGSVQPSRLTIPRNSMGQATVRFRPRSGAEAGAIAFAVTARGESDPAAAATAQGELEVVAVRKIAADLKMVSRVHGSARYALAVSNLGNTRVRAELRAITRGDEPRVEIDRRTLFLERGSTATVDLTARFPHPPLVGRRREVEFWVEAGGPDTEPVTVGARTIQRPAIPAWLAWTGGAIMAATLAVAAMVIWERVPDDRIEPYPQAVLKDKPLAFWQFDDPGSEVEDSAPGGSHQGTYEGGRVTVGVVGPFQNSTAVRLEGDSFVSLSEELQLSGDFTIEAWVLLEGDATEADHVVGREGCGENLNFYQERLRLFDPPDEIDCSEARRDEGQHDLIIASEPATLGEWTHWVVTRSGSQMAIYRNGDRDEDAVAPPRDPETFRIRALGVGHREEGQYLVGSLAYVAVYDRALSAEEVRSHYDAAL